MKVKLDNSSSDTLSVSGEQISSIFCVSKRAQIRTLFQWPLGTKILVPSPRYLIPLTSNCFRYFFKILGLGINIGPNFWDWVVAEILAARTYERTNL